MTTGEMLTIILTIGLPMLGGFGWMIKLMLSMQKEISNTKIDLIKEVGKLDSRIAHIEGYLIGARQKTGTQ